MKPRLIRPVYFVWLIVPLVLLGLWWAIGLPHMIWAYSFRANGARFDLDVARHYTSCTYIGPYGVFRLGAPGGKCAFIRFFHAQGGSGHAG